MPVDGSSAGIAVATAICSSITGKLVDNKMAMTGELSVRGDVRFVGGVGTKIEAARRARVKRVIVPERNWQSSFLKDRQLEIIPVKTLDEVLESTLLEKTKDSFTL